MKTTAEVLHDGRKAHPCLLRSLFALLRFAEHACIAFRCDDGNCKHFPNDALIAFERDDCAPLSFALQLAQKGWTKAQSWRGNIGRCARVPASFSKVADKEIEESSCPSRADPATLLPVRSAAGDPPPSFFSASHLRTFNRNGITLLLLSCKVKRTMSARRREIETKNGAGRVCS